jgi:hypothetical protein
VTGPTANVDRMAKKKVVSLAEHRRRKAEGLKSEEAADRSAAIAMAYVHHRKAYKLELEADMLPAGGVFMLVRLMHMIQLELPPSETFVNTPEVDWDAVAASSKFGAEFNGVRLRKIWSLVDWLGMLMIKKVSAEDFRRLDEAIAAITDTQSDSAKRRGVLREVAQSVEAAHLKGFWAELPSMASTPEDARKWVEEIARTLIQKLKGIDGAFAKLKIARVAALLLKTTPSDAMARGGAGKMAPTLLAARLSTEVRAFGDDNEAKSKKRYLAAEQSAQR